MDNSTGACIFPRSDGLEESTDRLFLFLGTYSLPPRPVAWSVGSRSAAA